MAEFPLTIGGEIFDHSFHVINNLSPDMRIGDDFPSTYDACIHRGKRLFIFQDKRVTHCILVRRREEFRTGKIGHLVSIQPYTQQIVSVACTSDFINTVQILKPVDLPKSEYLGIQITRVLLSTRGQKYCHL